MIESLPDRARRFDLPAALLGVVVIIALFTLMTRWAGPTATPVTADAFFILVSSLPLPLAWLAAAIGLGWPLRCCLAREIAHPIALQVALGIALMLTLDASLGAMGLLTMRAVAWAIIVLGVALLFAQLAKVRHLRADRMLPAWMGWACAPAVAVLMIAACSAPGWLWSSEFGGYDAMSYHLQVPKEWLAGGSAQPLDHNVYSFLPGYVEAAFLHLMSLRGDAMSALCDCQMLHALLTIVSAALTGALAARFGGRTLGALAAALYVATPWTIVVGSLAYNEMAVNVFLAAGLLLVFDDRISPARRGVLIGIVSAAATGAKLTSLGFVAAPLALALLIQTPARKWLPVLALAALAGIFGLLPYLLRNWAHAGNPLFPFATMLLGAAHWTPDQVQAWQRGHMPDVTIAHRFTALWHQFFAYGFGANPKPGEPWMPQWGVLPWLGVAGAILAVIRPAFRREAMTLQFALIAQLVFWLAFSHLQSRFLLPAAVPLCAMTSLGVQSLWRLSRAPTTLPVSRPNNSAVSLIFALVVCALSTLPLWIYHRESNGAPALAIGTIHQQTGDALDDAGRRELGTSTLPAVAVNWLLPPDSKVLLVGEATPLYYRLDRISYNTVWDRGPLSPIMRDNASDPEALREALRKHGFTHVLFNPVMLTIWERDHWNDPLITRRGVQSALESAAEPLFDYPHDITIYSLPQ